MHSTSSSSSGLLRSGLVPRSMARPRWWSGIAHHDSWAVSPWAVLDLHDDYTGRVCLSTAFFEDKHLKLAVDVAAVVLANGRSRGLVTGPGPAAIRHYLSRGAD